MESAENSQETVLKKPKRRAWKIVLWVFVVLVLVLIAGVIFVVPAYVSSDSCRQMILAKANATGAGAIDFADLSMSWVRGISVSKLTFKDNAQSMSVAVKEFSTKPHYGALLTGNLSFGRTVIDEPRIEIDVEKMKQKPAAQPGAPAQAEPKAGIPVQRIDLVVKDGDVKIQGGTGRVEVSQINSTVNLRPEGQRTDFVLAADIADGGATSTINAKGQVIPGKNWDLKNTSGDLTIEVNNLDLASLESILAVAGIEMEAKGMVSANLTGAVKKGVIEKVSGVVSGKGLEITAPQLKGDKIKTSVLDVAVEMREQGDLVNVEKLTVRTDWLKAQASGIAPMSLGTLSDFMKPDSKYELKANLECDLPAVVAQLPKTLGIKERTTINAGKLLGSVETLSEAGQKKLSGQVSIDGLAGSVEGKPISISEPIRAEAIISSEGKLVKFEKAQVTSAFAKVNCAGTMEAFDYDAQVDLARLAGELGQFADMGKYHLGGQVMSKGQVNTDSKAKTITVASSSNITNLRISPTQDITISEPSAAVEITTVIDNAAQTLLIKQLKADTSFGRFTVNDGKLPLAKGTKGPMSLTATAANVDLAKLQPYLAMSKAISKDVQLGGIAQSDVTVSFKDDSFRLTTESTKIANLMVKAPGKEPFTQNPVELSLDAEVNPTTKNWTIKADITSPNIKIKGNFQQKTENQTSNLQGNAQLDYDWKTLSSMLSAFMPSALVMEGKRKDTVNFSSRYPADKPDAMMANLNAQTKLGFDKAGYMGLNIGATNVDIKVDKGFLTIAPFTTTVNSGQLNFGGSADFKKKPALFRTPGPMRVVKDVQLNDEIANKLLARVNPVFSGALSVSGVANFDCNALAVPISGGRPEDVDITGTVSLTQVKMQPTGLLGAILSASGASGGETMTIHPTPFVVRDGFVRYTNMQMDIGNTPINFAGSVPLDANREIENLSITLPFAARGGIVKTDEQESKRRITAYVKGTPRHPQLDIGKTVQEELIQTGLELLLEKAKKK
jgi:hypothetical protein